MARCRKGARCLSWEDRATYPHLHTHTCTPAKREKGVTQNPDGHASKGDEKHERTVQRRVCGFGQRTNCGWVHSPPGMAAAYEPTPKGALALHLTGPLGKGRCDTVV